MDWQAMIKDVLQERAKTHGDYKYQAATAQAIKIIMRSTPRWGDLTAEQRESLELIATKLSRIGHGDPNHMDTWLDIAGYATLICDD